MKRVTRAKPEDVELAVPILSGGKSSKTLAQIAQGWVNWPTAGARSFERAANVEYRDAPDGYCVSLLAEGGVVWVKGQNPSWPMFLVTKRGEALIAPSTNLDLARDAKFAFSVGPWLVRKGQLCNIAQEVRAGGYTGLQESTPRERAAIGITADGLVVHVAVDKATLDEMATNMQQEGAVDAINLDGGGSVGIIDGKGSILLGYNTRKVCSALIFRRVVRTETTQVVAQQPASGVLVRLGLRYFEPWEHACPCCNTILVTPKSAEVMQRLDEMRAAFGSPIQIVPRDRSLARGFACEKRGGHSPNSRHYPPHGDARDISAIGRPQRELESYVLKYFGDGGIGTYAWGYHVDLGPKRRWTG